MFAPQTIQVRYGEDGNLAAAAAGVGRNAAYSRKQSQDMQFINDEANRQQQDSQFAAQQQAQQLQLAGQLAVARVRGNPTSAGAMTRGNSPFQQAVQSAKSAALRSAIANGDIQANDPEAILAANSPDVNSDQLLNLIERRKKTSAGDEATASDTKAKQSVVDASADTVDPEDADAIKGYINDPKLSIDGLRKVITESQRRRSNKEKATQQVQNRALTQQLQQGRATAAQSLVQAKQIEKDHPEINFQGPPSQFGPDETDSLQVYVQHQKLVMQANNIQARGDALAAGNSAYPEGTILHSPSTNRIFKVVNGQPTEITNNAAD